MAHKDCGSGKPLTTHRKTSELKKKNSAYIFFQSSIRLLKDLDVCIDEYCENMKLYYLMQEISILDKLT